MPLAINKNGEINISENELNCIPKNYNSLRSQAIDEILSRKPGFFGRWALIIFIFILLVLLISTWFIQYPDVVTVKAKLTSINPPKPVISKIGGKLIKLDVAENETIQAGTIIGFIESTADYKQVVAISETIDTIVNLQTISPRTLLSKVILRPYTNLGELQSEYQTFTQAFILFKRNWKDQLYERKKKRKMSSVQETFMFEQALVTFRSAINEWKKKYLLISPINGRINFAGYFPKDQYLQVNQTICLISPDINNFFAETFIPEQIFGKVKLGQKVLLKFSSYPSQEFGSVVGRIGFISDIPTDSGYLAHIILTNGLNTTYKKKVRSTGGLKANAEIITNNLRLLQKIYYNLRIHVKQE